MSWGVWETPAYDGPIAHGHDDLLLSAALDKQHWPTTTGPSTVIHRPDELTEIDASK